MLGVALQIAVIVALTILNGLFAMSETALVSSRKARLRERAQAGDKGARARPSPLAPRTTSSTPPSS
jgi:CBS domain containing-hemolysin-like protein